MNEKLRKRMKHLFFISIIAGMAFMIYIQQKRQSGIEESFFFPYAKNINKSEYHTNGNIKSMGQYRGNQKDGEWHYWDSTGIKTKVETYEYGKLVDVKLESPSDE